MPLTPSPRLWTIAVLCLSGLAALAQDDEPERKYLLKETPPAVGDVSIVERGEGEKVDIYATQRGTEAQIPDPTKFERHLQERYTETVLALDPEGAISQLKRVYTLARTVQTAGKLDPLKTVYHGRQGKTVVLKRLADKTSVTVANGKLSAAETKELAPQLDRAGGLNYLPDHEVGADDEWEIEEAQVLKAFGMEHGSLKARFIEVKPFRKHLCARINLDLQMQGKTAKGPIDWNLEGECYFALDLQRTLAYKLSGPVSTMGVGKVEGKVADLAGEGTGSMTLSRTWTKFGKQLLPIPAPTDTPPTAPAAPPSPR